MAKAITGSNIRSKAMLHEIHLQKTMLIVETGSEFSKPESNFVHKRGIISTKIYGIIENKFSSCINSAPLIKNFEATKKYAVEKTVRIIAQT